MRALLAVLLMMLLAGCSGGGGLSAHVMTPGDLGAGYEYAAMDHEEYGMFFDFLGMESNPGRAEGEPVEDDLGGNITAIYIAVIDHVDSDGSVFSAAIAYTNAAEARKAAKAEFADDCDDPAFGAYVSGAIIHVHDGESLPEDEVATFASALDGLVTRTNAVSVCDV